MAKSTKAVSFQKAQINLEDMTLTEYLKDETNTFNIMDILKEWDGIDNINWSIKQDNTINEIKSESGEDEE